MKHLLFSCLFFLLIAIFGLWPFRAWGGNQPRGYSRQGEISTRLEVEEYQRLARTRRTKPATPAYLPWDLPKPIHIMFTFVDHWEPSDYVHGGGWGGPYYESEALRLANLWLNEYIAMASKHRDADGRMPQHTWFTYQPALAALKAISKSCYLGGGEIELHLHHGTDNETGRDNTEELKKLTGTWLTYMNGVGACRTAQPQPRNYFGFIHGMWALDNSRIGLDGNRQYCGVNRELEVLASLGCYGDFTFPAGFSMQPPVYNQIFLARDSDDPKSYGDSTLIREVCADDWIAPNEFLLFEGPGGGAPDYNLDKCTPPTLGSMVYWLNSYIHIPGRDNWIFVKIMTHSAQSLADSQDGINNLLGSTIDQFYTDIEREYNDGVNYKLHYVTTREVYNITRAAVDGMDGDPGQYRDYEIAPPANKYLYLNAEYQLLRYTPHKPSALLEIKTPLSEVRPLVLWARDFPTSSTVFESDRIEGPFISTDARITSSTTARLVLKDDTPSHYYHLFNGRHAASHCWRRYR